jgi:hypothetical protein
MAWLVNMIYEIYLITDTKNDKKYVGHTARGIQARFMEHKNSTRGLGKIIKEVGEEYFIVEKIDTVEGENEVETANFASFMESYYIFL